VTTYRSPLGRLKRPALAGLLLAVAVGLLWENSALAGFSQSAAAFDSNKAWEHLRQQVAIGPRPSGTPANVKTRDYIKAQMAALGIKVTEQPFDGATPLGPVKMVNLIATLPGKSPDRIILASHFDNKLFRDVRFVGASDGASSTAALIEIGRVLKARKELPFTYELLFLDGEEAVIEWQGTDNTYGSRHYVDAARKSGSLKSIKAFILLDMIGDRNLTIRRESNSTRWLTDIVWGVARKLKQPAFMDEETTVEDDHIPFVKAGVASLDIIDLDYPQWHTPQDTIEQVAARSLQIVGDVVVESLPLIEQRLAKN
jgi:Zn-dependent M28 family amino/carboxypeptidase